MKDHFDALMAGISKRPTRDDVQELTEAVRTVSEQVECCRQAIDELTELLEHTVQNTDLTQLLQEHANLIISAVERMQTKEKQARLF